MVGHIDLYLTFGEGCILINYFQEFMECYLLLSCKVSNRHSSYWTQCSCLAHRLLRHWLMTWLNVNAYITRKQPCTMSLGGESAPWYVKVECTIWISDWVILSTILVWIYPGAIEMWEIMMTMKSWVCKGLLAKLTQKSSWSAWLLGRLHLICKRNVQTWIYCPSFLKPVVLLHFSD